MTIPLLLLETHLAHATAAVRRRLATTTAEAMPGLAGLAAELAQALHDLGAPGQAATGPVADHDDVLTRVRRQSLRLAAAVLAVRRGEGPSPAAEVAAAAQHFAMAHGRPVPFTELLTTMHRLCCDPHTDGFDPSTGTAAADAAAAALALASVALTHRTGAP